MIRSVHAAQKLSLPPSRPVNMQLGSYEPCFEIGSGGMASVYIAREHGHSGLQRTVALKVMHEHLARRDEFKNRFLDEARVLTQIAHPFVCRVVGYGEDSGRPFMAMEYLIGEPLSRILRAMKRRGQSLSTARRARLFARVVADLAEGLHAAHEARDYEGKPMGVVHRDITPHNLFLLYDGTVRVLDFGIARFADRNVHTVSNALLSKLPYMAPEQMQGEGYDRRVDVWALGVVLWELVTLGRLFKRETEIRTMRAVCTDRIPSLAEFTPDVPAGLEQVIGRALQRDPDERYPTARALSHALEMWLGSTGEPVTHGETSEFLNGFFPGSQLERQRWAQQSSPAGSGVRRAMGNSSDDGSLSQPNPFAEHGPEATSATSAQAEPEPVTAEYVHPQPASVDVLPVLTNVPDDDAEVTVKRHIPPLESDTKDLRARSVVTVTSGSSSQSARTAMASVPPVRSPSRASWLTGFAAVALFASTLAVAHVGQKQAAADDTALSTEKMGQPAGVAQPASPAAQLASPPTVSEAVHPHEARRGEEGAATKSLVHSPHAEEAPSIAGSTEPTPAKVADATVSKPKQAPPVSPAPTRAVARAVPRTVAAPTATEPAAPSSAPALPATGDVLIVSSTPGVKVFLGARLLGTTPVKTRLPAGPTLLSLQVGAATDRIPMSAQIAPGRLNMLSVNLSR